MHVSAGEPCGRRARKTRNLNADNIGAGQNCPIALAQISGAVGKLRDRFEAARKRFACILDDESWLWGERFGIDCCNEDRCWPIRRFGDL